MRRCRSSSRASSVMTSFIAAPVYADDRSGPSLEAQRAVVRARRRAHRAHDPVDLLEQRRLGGEGGVLGGRPAAETPARRPPPGGANRPVGRDGARGAHPGAACRPRVSRPPGRCSSVASSTANDVKKSAVRRSRTPRRPAASDGAWASKPGAAEPAAARLALELRDRAEREVQHLDRMPGAERLEPRRVGVVVPALDLHLGMRAMRDLLVGVEDRLLVAGVGRRRRAERSCARRRTRRRPGAAGSGASSRGRRRSGRAPSQAHPSATRRAATRTRPRPS